MVLQDAAGFREKLAVTKTRWHWIHTKEKRSHRKNTTYLMGDISTTFRPISKTRRPEVLFRSRCKEIVLFNKLKPMGDSLGSKFKLFLVLHRLQTNLSQKSPTLVCDISYTYHGCSRDLTSCCRSHRWTLDSQVWVSSHDITVTEFKNTRMLEIGEKEFEYF